MKSIAALLPVFLALGHGQQQFCDSACQTAYKSALAGEASAWVSNITTEEIYTTPANSSDAKPGDLLRWQDLPQAVVNRNFSAPSGTSISRYLYMSEDIDRKPIPASGFVLLPYSRPDPNEPLKTVVWTHGTAGRIRQCAPSISKDLYYEWSGPFALVQAGFAVIAPDYAGQGSDIPQGFMYESGFLHAADAAYGLIAARKVIGDVLSDKWAVVGHSEGGMTAWRVNERLAMPDQEELLKAGEFVGAVANSPALRPLDLIPESIRRAKGGPIGDAVSVILLQSWARLFPNDFRIEDYLTDLALARVPLLDQGCLLSGHALFGGLSSAELFRNTSFLTHPSVVNWQKTYNGAGPHALAAPMFVPQGIADILVYANNTEWDFNQTCNAFPESKVTLKLYPDSDHDVTAVNAQYETFQWLKARFAGEEAAAGCSKVTAEPVMAGRTKNIGSFYSRQVNS